jgi:hypothetical protein
MNRRDTKAFLEMANMAKLPPRRPKPKGMNKTEKEFSWMLEAQKRQGKITRWVYEGVRLQWGIDPDTAKAMWYKADFFAFLPVGAGRTRVIEVKGEQIWKQDMIRFKGCRAEWPDFQFEMWQKTKKGWKQIY